jgi:hypothetical protein
MFVVLYIHFIKQKLNTDIASQEAALKDLYTYTDRPEEALFGILPLSWNEYYKQHKTQEALTFIQKCKEAGIPVASYIADDYGVTPQVKDIYIFRPSGYQSCRLPKQFSAPYFVNDYLQRRFHRTDIYLREKETTPMVGFCGQGKVSPIRNMAHLGVIALNNMKFRLGISQLEPQVWYPPVLRRTQALDILRKSARIKTNFIIRENYRGGAETKEALERTTQEFYDNLIHSDYILCIRGGGNFSVRLYETLMMGRIPLFINTDCILPFDHLIDWKKHLVWVEEKDMKYAPEILADFHHDLHPDDFKQLQLSNRKLWEDYLNTLAFFTHLAEMMKAERNNN